MMKKLIASTALAVALSAGSALAADLPSHKAPILPPPPPPPLWTGFYVGLNAGGTFGGSNSFYTETYNYQATPNLAFGPASAALGTQYSPISENSGFIGGGQIGYNYQFRDRFVAGIEADIQGIAASHSSVTTGSAISATGGAAQIGQVLTASKSIDYLGTVRGRLGYLVTPTLLAYATGGLAYGGVNASASITQVVFSQPPAYSSWGSFSDTRVGWTVGGGLEWMFLPNWSAKVEYLYYDLGNVTFNHTPLINPGAIAGVTWYSGLPTSRTRFDGHIVRAGVNYHFNLFGAPAAVVAKY